MEKNNFSEKVNQVISALPPEMQGMWKELVRSIEQVNEKRLELTLNKITSSDLYMAPEKEMAGTVSNILLLCLKEAYINPRTPHFAIFTSILPVFTGFISRQAKNPDLKDHPKFLMTLGEQFAVAFYDNQTQTTVVFDNFYEFHLQNIRDFLASPGFKGWRTQEGTDEFLRACASRWLVHLGNYARNRREKPFLNLLDLSLLLLRNIPEFLPVFQGMTLILPTAKKAFHYIFASGDDGILKILDKSKKAANPDLKPVMDEWINIYTIGALPEVPRASDFEESPELTVPFVYRTMLEEIMGDGVITSDEEWIVKNMREYLEIPNEKYNKIFTQVQEAKSLKKIPDLDRDFSPKVFLSKILAKTIEDGVITDEEKSIIGKIAGALLLNQETIAEVFQEVKKAYKAGGGKTAVAINKDLEKLQDLVRYAAMEERIRPVLVSDRGMKVYNKAGKMLALLKQKAKPGPDEDINKIMGRSPVATFYYEPQTYLYPVVVLFIESADIHPIRLLFKTGRIDAEFTEDVKSKTGEDTLV